MQLKAIIERESEEREDLNLESYEAFGSVYVA